MTGQLQKYLKTRAAGAPWELAGAAGGGYGAAVVIPVLAESEELPRTLESLAGNPATELRRILVVVVVNNRKSASQKHKADNRKTLDRLRSSPFRPVDVAWVDASSPGFELPEKEGVGLARKIGFDLALERLAWRDDPLLVSLDADTVVDCDYLAAIFAHFETSSRGGAVIPFRHRNAADPEVEKAIRGYELYLRSYLFGLQRAGSPYAYHTIGSAFACRAAAYVAAGGMNRRHAGEDFYFLQQLAKVGGVDLLGGTIVRPSPRFSERVPFGTGRAVRARVVDERCLYSFVCADAFRLLKSWLELVGRDADCSAERLLESSRQLSAELASFLEEGGFEKVWSRFLRQHRAGEGRIKAFHDWFDALKTRQLLTRVDQGAVTTPARRVEALLAWGGYPGYRCETRQLALLERLQLPPDR